MIILRGEIMDRTFKIVKRCIDKWDPYCLLESGCPRDEFDIESRMIAQRISPTSSADEVIHVISEVFSAQFESQYFGVDDCTEVGLKIHTKLSKLKQRRASFLLHFRLPVI